MGAFNDSRSEESTGEDGALVDICANSSGVNLVTSFALAVDSTASRLGLVATLSNVEDSVTANGTAVSIGRANFESGSTFSTSGTCLGDALAVEGKARLANTRAIQESSGFTSRASDDTSRSSWTGGGNASGRKSTTSVGSILEFSGGASEAGGGSTSDSTGTSGTSVRQGTTVVGRVQVLSSDASSASSNTSSNGGSWASDGGASGRETTTFLAGIEEQTSGASQANSSNISGSAGGSSTVDRQNAAILGSVQVFSGGASAANTFGC